MEAAADRDFGTLMRETIFEPLGMRHTTVDDQRRIIPNRSGLYAHDDKGYVVNAKLTDHSYKIPGGGILSTAEDLVRCRHFLCSVGEFVRSLRVQYSCRRIVESTDSLATIALDAGFSDQAHLSRLVRRHIRMSPSRLRFGSRN